MHVAIRVRTTTKTDMEDLLIKTGLIILICSPTASIIAFGICNGVYARTDKHPKYPDKRELDRREYETMLRHRRRAKLEKQFSTSLHP